MIETAIVIPRGDARLFGVMAEPAAEPRRPIGVVVIVGGPQYRAGSHRQFVALARRLAGAGYPTLRFDLLGMGDSLVLDAGGGVNPIAHFESAATDIGAAIDALHAHQPALRGCVLWGLCDGASAALLHAAQQADARVHGLVLLNPWVRTQASQAATRVRHYYLQRLLSASFWRKLLRGQVAADALRGLWRNLRLARAGAPAAEAAALAYPQRMAQGWRRFVGDVLLLMSGKDYTAREFDQFTRGDALWQRAFAARAGTRVDLPDADHTCSQASAEAAVHDATLAFLDRLATRAR
jgi:exosortase A-associated hydrolase 1